MACALWIFRVLFTGRPGVMGKETVILIGKWSRRATSPQPIWDLFGIFSGPFRDLAASGQTGSAVRCRDR